MSVSRLLPPEIIRQVADANLIEEVIGADLPLRKTGAVLTGLCPFHQERSPSFTVTPSRQRYKCFGCGAGGDVFAYCMARQGVGFLPAAHFLAQRGGIHLEALDAAATRPTNLAPRAKMPVRREEPVKALLLPSDLRAAAGAALQAVAARRALSAAGLELASARGLFWTGTGRTRPAWIVTAQRRAHAQARRVDGRSWEHIGGKKAWTLPGSRAAWPIGAAEADGFPCVALVEGGPDLLAAHYFIVAEDREADTAAIAMLGAANVIPEDALLLLANKRVRLFPHLDAAGREAAVRWTRQLERVGCEVDAFAFEGLRRGDGGAVEDLNDLAMIDADDFEQERAELMEVLPR